MKKGEAQDKAGGTSSKTGEGIKPQTSGKQMNNKILTRQEQFCMIPERLSQIVQGIRASRETGKVN